VEPKTPYLAKFNLPFCIATALRYGRVGLEAFSPERLRDPALLALMPKVQVLSDPDLTRCFPRRWPARAEVRTRDGRRLKGANEYPKGDPENPLSEDEVIRKFRGLVEGLVSPSAAEAMVEAVMALETKTDVAAILVRK
jgi:2-methylcitrate dehydratase PrpD